MIRGWVVAGALSWAACGQTPKFVHIPEGPGQERFWMAETETTAGQFAAFVKATGYRTEAERAGATRTWRAPGFPVHPRQPVVYVTPSDAIAFCGFIDARLPGDAEWEYAARAGAATRHYWGEVMDGRYLWYRANSKGAPHSVGRKRPNAWGLYDVEGNVWEWTLPRAAGEALASRRGGSWMDCEDIDSGPGRQPARLIALSTGFKIRIDLSHRYDDIGFRCVRSKP